MGWLMAFGRTLGALGIPVFTSRGWFGPRRQDPGRMSQQWLVENQAGRR